MNLEPSAEVYSRSLDMPRAYAPLVDEATLNAMLEIKPEKLTPAQRQVLNTAAAAIGRLYRKFEAAA